MSDLHWQWIGRISDILSLIGTMVGFFVFMEVRKLKWELMRRGRIGPLMKDLKTHAGEIQQLLRDFPTSQTEVPVRLAQVESTLNFAVKITSGKDRKPFLKVTNIVALSRRQVVTENDLRQIYADTMHLVENLKQMQEEMKWQA